MNNIIANLRRDRPLSWENRLEAADEIFRLREENERLREENDAWRMDGGSCAEEVKRLREENARLREALKPFAAAAEDLDEDDKDNLPIWEHWAAGSVEIGHLRAAAAAIRGNENVDGS